MRCRALTSLLRLLPAAALAASAACSPPRPALPPRVGTEGFAPAWWKAANEEAQSSTSWDGLVQLLRAAAAQPEAPGALASTLAAIDTLLEDSAPGLDNMEESAAIFRRAQGPSELRAALEEAWEELGHHAVPTRGAHRQVLARALFDLALFRGDAAEAARWSARAGCPREVTLLGPLHIAPLVDLQGPRLVPPGGPLPSSTPGVGAFGRPTAARVIQAGSCRISFEASGSEVGTRLLAVDVELSSPRKVTLSLSSAEAAKVEVGGRVVLERPFSLGGLETTRWVSLSLPAGRTRLLTQVAWRGASSAVTLNVVDEEGLPLPLRAPRPGDLAAAPGLGRSPESAPGGELLDPGPKAPPQDASEAELGLAAAALLAVGEDRAAERLLEPRTRPSGPMPAAPLLRMLHLRSLSLAEDLPSAMRLERTAAELQRLQVELPQAWRTRVELAQLRARQRGIGDGPMAALLTLRGEFEAGTPSVKTQPQGLSRDPLLLAQQALTARTAELLDVSEGALRTLREVAPGSALLEAVEQALHPPVGPEAVDRACRGSARSRATNECFAALLGQQRDAEAKTELGRLRALHGDPHFEEEGEVRIALHEGKLEDALRAYDAQAPASRSMLPVLGYAAALGKREEAHARLQRDALDAADSPHVLSELRAALGAPDLALPLEALSDELVARDRSQPFLPDAAVAVLLHVEDYELHEDGMLSSVLYDLRRVSGTTDVDQGARSDSSYIHGEQSTRSLRRRIYKKDGRIIEPDGTLATAQDNSELSQLEQGDYVEEIRASDALPDAIGHLTLDTPDLLPERQSVRLAELHLRRPAKLPLQVWAHPRLGTPVQSKVGPLLQSTWRLENAVPRRLEDGIPPMERGVSLSFGTRRWEDLSLGLAEQQLSLQDQDPVVAAWARQVAGPDLTPGRSLLERLSSAVGRQVRISSTGGLGDSSLFPASGTQSTTSRTILEQREGSRSVLLSRALGELGVRSELALAETDPWSPDPSFPVHPGRFGKVLLLVHLPEGEVWVDADVEGPPLPPGLLSPELRGRSALLAGGRVVTLPTDTPDTGDVVDLRLTVDETGNAKGECTLLLRGKAAQSLTESFQTVVGTARQELLRSLVLGWLPWADVEDVVLSSLESSWEVRVRAQIAIQGYARPEGSSGQAWSLPGLEPVHFVLPDPFTGTLGATVAAQAGRDSALSIARTMQYQLRRRIELPPDLQVTHLPTPLGVQDPRLSASRTTTTEGQVVEERFALNLPSGTVPAPSYPEFVRQVHAVDDAFLAGTRVEKRSSKGRGAKAPAPPKPGPQGGH